MENKTEVEYKHFASEKVGNLRRWNNKILKKADVVRKMKMPSVNGVARKREGGETGIDKLFKVCKMALPERDGIISPRKRTTHKGD